MFPINVSMNSINIFIQAHTEDFRYSTAYEEKEIKTCFFKFIQPIEGRDQIN